MGTGDGASQWILSVLGGTSAIGNRSYGVGKSLPFIGSRHQPWVLGSHVQKTPPQHAMHLKSIGAICARTLSYEDCEFALVNNDSDEKAREVYNSSAELWGDLLSALGDRCATLQGKSKKDRLIEQIEDRGDSLPDHLQFHQDLHRDSDREDEYDSEDEEDEITEQMALRRKYRNRTAKTLRGLFWSAHQVRLYF